MIAVVMLIGVVILLAVAVTGMVFILIDDQPKDAPKIAFSESEAEGRWILTTAPREIPWSAYEMRVTGNLGLVKVRLNDEAGAGGWTIPPSLESLPKNQFPGDLTAGQFLDFCAAVNEPNTRIILVHSASQAVANQYVFDRLNADPSCV